MTITGTSTISKRCQQSFSVITFGTRNWTVRDIPPSHEAISIMKPADENRQTEFWRRPRVERPPKFVGQKSIKLPSNKQRALSFKVCHRVCITELNLFKESQRPKGQLRAKTSGGHDSVCRSSVNATISCTAQDRARPARVGSVENTDGADAIFKDTFLFLLFRFPPSPFREH